MMIKIKNKTLAIVVATPSTPLKPKIPAIIAIIKNMIAHINIKNTPVVLLTI